MSHPNVKGKDPPIAEVIRIWRSNGIAWSSIRVYLPRIRLFRKECLRSGKIPEEQLTHDVVERWAVQYSHSRSIDTVITKHRFSCALSAWSWGLKACGYSVPPWYCARGKSLSLSPLQKVFATYLKDVKGVSESTILRDLGIIQDFMGFMRHRGRHILRVRIIDINKYMESNRNRFALKTLGRAACALRSFFHFLYMSGRLSQDMADMVSMPRIRRNDSPPRALPWPDVRRILTAIDRKRRIGRRDYAMLLMMAAYGFGAGEVRTLTLDSIDWERKELHVTRPKTGRDICLPLLTDVARSLAAYLRNGRPHHCTSRALFVRVHAPYGGLQSSGAIRHVIRKYASAAGVSAEFLGSHVFRHSHATRQIDIGTPATIVGDILGHRSTESTSVYVKVAFRRLRNVSLPVPL